jgi:hypothetical protein
MSEVNETLAVRETTYGSYLNVALYAQILKSDIRNMKNWQEMPPHMRESLDMICNKIGRIMSGDPYYIDSWHDIAGYATLVVNTLEE